MTKKNNVIPVETEIYRKLVWIPALAGMTKNKIQTVINSIKNV